MNVGIIGGGPAGLYFAILFKKSRPSAKVTVYEKNPADQTWGWGVVFSDETMENFRVADKPSHDAIQETFARWTAIDVHFRGRMVRSGGHSFCGIRRAKLLQILQARASELGVAMHFDVDLQFEGNVEDDPRLKGCDLIIAADGIHSRVRESQREVYAPDITLGRSKFIWLGSDKSFDTFTFYVRENQHGLFQVHAYQFDEGTSTFIVETSEEAWRAAGLDKASEAESIAYCQELFAEELAGAKLMGNRSSWISFSTIRCKRWHHSKTVLLGDAAHTAHFSIGSGTKLAMEDAIELEAALRENGDDVARSLDAYWERRWLDVAKLQRAADVSRHWFEDIGRYHDFAPEQFAVSLLSRSKRVTHGNLKLRDPAYVEQLDRWYATSQGWKPRSPSESAPPPMFVPFRLRDLELNNRVVVSPMCMYRAVDGIVNDWHMVHLGSRAIGGAGLVITEMTDVSAEGRISPGCAGLWNEQQAAAWRPIVEFVHQNSGAKLCVQLGHAGRKASTKLSWEGDNQPLETGGWETMACSPIPWDQQHSTPREMTRHDMDVVRDEFVASVRRAVDIGFDMVELHFAHGYLLSGFISPLSNTRDDEYGGDLQGRMRYPLEIVDAVRAVMPAGMPLSVRVSATDWAPGGLSNEESVELAKMLAAHGVDIIDVSAGQTSPLAEPIYGRMFQTPFSDRIRNEGGIKTIAVGNITDWDQVNTIIASGRADLCAIARGHLYDPYFTLHAAAEQGYRGASWPLPYLSAQGVAARIFEAQNS